MDDFKIKPVDNNPGKQSADTGSNHVAPGIPLAGVPATPRSNDSQSGTIPGVTVTDEHGTSRFIPLPGIPSVRPEFRDNMVKPGKPPSGK